MSRPFSRRSGPMAARTRRVSARPGTTATSTSPAGWGRGSRATSQENPACTISMRLPGIDVVFEGEASLVTDQETIETLVGIYREGGWPAEASRGGYHRPVQRTRAPARRRGTCTASASIPCSGSRRRSRTAPCGGASGREPDIDEMVMHAPDAPKGRPARASRSGIDVWRRARRSGRGPGPMAGAPRRGRPLPRNRAHRGRDARRTPSPARDRAG